MDKHDIEALYPQGRMWFNGGMAEEPFYACKRGIYTAKGRGTSLEEREKIVKFCLEYGKDYVLTVKTFKISYQQIYSWVRKYEKKGVDGLTDRRGRSKSEEELTEEDRLRRENRSLRDRIKEQEAEIALLKRALSSSFGSGFLPASTHTPGSDAAPRGASGVAPDFTLSSHAPVSDVASCAASCAAPDFTLSSRASGTGPDLAPPQPLLLAEDL